MTEQLVTKKTRTGEHVLDANRPEDLPEVEVVDQSVRQRLEQALQEREEFSLLPIQLIQKYAGIATRHANLRRIGRGEWFADIPGFQGVWASESSSEHTLEVLREVVEDWTLLKIEHRDNDLPVIEEIDLNGL